MSDSRTSPHPVTLQGRRHATADDVVAELDDVVNQRDEFLVLERADGRFMQAAANVVEYHEADEHYRFTGAACDRATMERLLLSYFADDERWRTLVRWTNVTADLARQGTRASWAAGLVILLALVGGAVWFFWWFRAH